MIGESINQIKISQDNYKKESTWGAFTISELIIGKLLQEKGNCETDHS